VDRYLIKKEAELSPAFAGLTIDAALLAIVWLLWLLSDSYQRVVRRRQDERLSLSSLLTTGSVANGSSSGGSSAGALGDYEPLASGPDNGGRYFRAQQRLFDSSPLVPGTDPMEVEFEKLTLTLRPSKKVVLAGASGALRRGTLTAVLGPSGAGKSSLLAALACRAGTAEVGGTVRIDGVPDSLEKHAGVVGFVPQDDIMYAQLTVEENLTYAARLRLPAQAGKHSIAGRVDITLRALGLHECRHDKAGRVSGGQRKRCNVGLELVSGIRLLLADEPTSGNI
jgi:ABC-type lipoprotein export system ATPase subunit